MIVGEAEVAQSTAGGRRPQRVVLLGASNLTLSFGAALDQARAVWGGPLEVLAALGLGRSFGLESRFWGRTLPGILDCGLWPALTERPPAAVAALLTDVGNDIMFGADPATIVQWVERCLDRLAAVDARVVLTLLPLASVARLSPGRYLLFRSCFFPGCRLSRAEALRRGEALQIGLEAIAVRRGVPTVCQPADWYGFDPIHLRRGVRREAWNTILAPWREGPLRLTTARSGLSQSLYLQRLRPERQRRFGIERCAAQPAGRLRDGTTIALY